MRSSAAIPDECCSLQRDERHRSRACPRPLSRVRLLAAVAAMLLFLSVLLLFDSRNLLASQQMASALPPSELHALLEAEGREEAQAFALHLPHNSAANEPPSPAFVAANPSMGVVGEPTLSLPPLFLLFGPAGADHDDLVVDFIFEPLLRASSSKTLGAAAAGGSVCRHDLAADARPRMIDRASTGIEVCSWPDGLPMARVGLLVSRELRLRWETYGANATSARKWTERGREVPASTNAAFIVAGEPALRPHIVPHGSRTPFLVLLLRDPLEAIVAEYNGRPVLRAGRNSAPTWRAPAYGGGEFGAARHIEPIKRFASAYRRLFAGRNLLACTLAAEPLPSCDPRLRPAGRSNSRQAQSGRRGRRSARAANRSRETHIGADIGRAQVGRLLLTVAPAIVAPDELLGEPLAEEPGQTMAAQDLAIWRAGRASYVAPPAPPGWPTSALFGAYLVPRRGRPSDARLKSWEERAGATLALLDGERGWPFVLESFEESAQGLCAAMMKWKLVPSPASPSGGSAASPCALLPRSVAPAVGGAGRTESPGRELRPEDVRADVRLASEVFANEFLDFRLYRAARLALLRLLQQSQMHPIAISDGLRLQASRFGMDKGATGPAGLRCSPAGRLCTANLSNHALRRWADPWPRRVERLQGIAPPVWDNVSGISTHQLLFIHIPKCAGSSFRNGMLLEFTRVHRKARDLGCVFYRDVHFRERQTVRGDRTSNASAVGSGEGHLRRRQGLLRAGPDCLLEDGMIDPSLPVLTGHIGFGSALLSRIGTPFTALVFLREPLSRLVSLFNMYPAGTWGGLAPRNWSGPISATSSAVDFARAYRASLAGRNALTCFVSGDQPCDSRGATIAGSLGSSSLRRAQYNLLHRFAAFGLTERLQESLALVAYTLGWRHFYEKPAFNAAVHVAPGEVHKRLAVEDLCAIPTLLHDLGRAERPDRALHTFAASVFEQRIQLLPPDLLALARLRAGAPSAPTVGCPTLSAEAILAAAAAADKKDLDEEILASFQNRSGEQAGDATGPALSVLQRDRVLASPDDPVEGAVYLPRRTRPLPAPTRLFNDDGGTFDTIW